MSVSAKARPALLAAAVLAAAMAAAACTIGSPAPLASESTQAEERIAFAANRDGNLEIYTIKPDGTDLRQVTDNDAEDSWPVWSPDGTRIAFISNRDNGYNVYTVAPDGTGLRMATRSGIVSQEANLAWSPDGMRIAFTAINQQIFAANVNGTLPPQVTPNGGTYVSAAWSPDGTRIALASLRDGNPQLHTIAPDGTGLTAVPPDSQSGTFPAWSPDGSRILFRSSRTGDGSGGADLHVVAPNGTGMQQILADGQFNAFPSWSPDGRRIAFGSTSPGSASPDKFDLYTMAADGTDRQLFYRDASLGGVSWTARAVGASNATLIDVPSVNPGASAVTTPETGTVSTTPETPAVPATPPANMAANYQPQMYSGKVVSITSEALIGIAVEARIGSTYVSAPAVVGADGIYTITVNPPSSVAGGLLNQRIEFNMVGTPDVKAYNTGLYTGVSIPGAVLPLDLVFPAS